MTTSTIPAANTTETVDCGATIPAMNYNIEYLFADACICGAERSDDTFCPDCRAQHENLLSTALKLPNQAALELPTLDDLRPQYEKDLIAGIPALVAAAIKSVVEPGAIDTTLLPNGNLHIRIGGMTIFCGAIETARQLHAALGLVFLAADEQADVNRLAAHVRKELADLAVAPIVARVMERQAA